VLAEDRGHVDLGVAMGVLDEIVAEQGDRGAARAVVVAVLCRQRRVAAGGTDGEAVLDPWNPDPAGLGVFVVTRLYAHFLRRYELVRAFTPELVKKATRVEDA